MKKDSVSKKEPRVVFDVVFEVNDIPLPPKEFCISGFNLTKDGLVEFLDKENKRITEIIIGAAEEGEETVVINGFEIPLNFSRPNFVLYSSATIKESFLNPDLRPKDMIVNPSFH